MVWENLVGASHELTFRVTAALSKLLEPDPSARVSLQRELADTYNVQSRVVHGDSEDPARISEAAKQAQEHRIKFALRGCQAIELGG